MSGGGFGTTKAALHRADTGFGRARTVQLAAATGRAGRKHSGGVSPRRIGAAFVRGLKDGTVAPVVGIGRRLRFLAGMPGRLSGAASSRGFGGLRRQLANEARAEASFELGQAKGLVHTGYVGLEMSPLGAPVVQRQIQRNGVQRTAEHLAYDGGSQVPTSAAIVATDGVAGRISSLRAAAAAAALPRGFTSFAEFAQFGSRLKSGLTEAGFADTEAAIQGSAATGAKFTTGEGFDVGRTSDFDVALGGDEIMDAARNAGVELRTRGTRTGPLGRDDVAALGMTDLQLQLSKLAGRKVDFMVYRSIDAALTRRPGIMIP